jgi:AAHS family 4-hydroxybenzoate transporter-like MFS transporter
VWDSFSLLCGREGDKATAILKRMDTSNYLSPYTRYVLSEPRLKGLTVAHLFKAGRLSTTLLIWVVFFASLLDLYLLQTWLPSVLSELGVSLSAAAAAGAMFQVGGVIGTLALGLLVDRFSFRLLAFTYFGASISVVAVIYLEHSLVLASGAIFCAGFCIVGAQIASNAMATSYYPTAMRATGISWALGIGRIGSIIGPIVGGMILAHGAAVDTLFITAALPALVASVASLALGRLSV